MPRAGWIRLYRSLLDSWFQQLKPEYFKLGITVLLLANWEDSVTRGGVAVKKGQLLTSLDALQKECPGVSRPQIRRGLMRMQTDGLIVMETTRRFSLISIVNWQKYQPPQDSTGTPTGTPTGTETGTIKEVQESKEGSMSEVGTSDGGKGKKSKSKPKTPPPERAFKAADYLRARIVANDPGHKLSHTFTDSQREKWAKTFDLINRKDQRSWEDIGRAVKWLFDSDNTFVVLSPQSLREKFDNIRAAMKTNQPAQYVNGQRKVPPPAPLPPEPKRISGESFEEWEKRRAKERKEKNG